MSLLKAIGLFVLKAVCFTVVFWVVWLYALRPITTPAQNTNTSPNDAQARAQVEAYEQQVKRATEQQNVAETQQKRMEKILSIQEEQIQRYNSVLEKWEKQTGVKK